MEESGIKREKTICVGCNKEFLATKSVLSRIKNGGVKNVYCSEECRNSVSKKKREIDYLKSAYLIYSRDNFQCVYCGQSSIEHGVQLHIDHVYPKSMGGENDYFNLVTSCENCNLLKNVQVLSLDVLFRIWDRNINHEKSKHYDYKSLKEEFDKRFLRQMRRLASDE